MRAGTIHHSWMDSRSRTAIAAIRRWAISSFRRSKRVASATKSSTKSRSRTRRRRLRSRRLFRRCCYDIDVDQDGGAGGSIKAESGCLKRVKPRAIREPGHIDGEDRDSNSFNGFAVLMRLIINAQFDARDAHCILCEQLNL